VRRSPSRRGDKPFSPHPHRLDAEILGFLLAACAAKAKEVADMAPAAKT
jgi:hypothetical protein